MNPKSTSRSDLKSSRPLTGSGTLILSSSLKIMSIDPGATRLLGDQPGPGQPFEFSKAIDPETIIRFTGQVDEVLGKGISFDHTRLSLVSRNGRAVSCRASMSPLYGLGRQITGVIIQLTRQQALNTQKSVHKGLRYLPRLSETGIFNGLPNGVFTIDRRYKVSSFNKQAEQLTGFKRKDVMGKYCWQVFQGGQCRNDCPFKDIFETGINRNTQEMTFVGSDGGSRKMITHAAPIKDDQHGIIGGIESFCELNSSCNLPNTFRDPDTFEGMVGQSPLMKTLFAKLPDIAASHASVLLTGESGTGKELIARALHALSHFKKGPFQAVNCAALPETLLESELFGHEKGAFTNAEQSKPGRFELAAGGTLFLDEIGELKPSLQVKLLRVLEQKTFERVGSDRPVQLAARVIAATNRDLNRARRQGTFRQDLYYRLRTVPIHVPPVRERKADIPLLVNHFIKKFNHRYDKQVRAADPAVLEQFSIYDWPGNIRELERALEHAFVFVKGPVIFARYLPENMNNPGSRVSEKQQIIEALEENGHQRVKTASRLGISRTSLWRKMRTHHLL